MEITELVFTLADKLRKAQLTVATAESCTGGLIAGAMTDLPGSSEWFKGSIVAYANQVKKDMLSVPEELLRQYGAVSEPVVRAMAEGVRRRLKTETGLSVSGIAGPGGALPGKPVGMVCFGFALHDRIRAATHFFSGSRQEIRTQSVKTALVGILDMLDGA